MKYFSLILAALRRSRTRTILTILSVVTAFLLFGLLDAVRVAFNAGNGDAGAQRLVAVSRLSLTQTLPVTLEREVATIPGVKRVASSMWFGGIYQDPRNFFPNFSVGPGYFDLFPEYEIAPDQLQAFENDPAGAIVGRSLAEQFGWKLGDVIPLQATIFPNRDGSNNWPLNLRGIFDVSGNNTNSDRVLYMHWHYFNESNAYIRERITSINVLLEDPSKAGEVAQAIDRKFENSDHETRTQSEQAFFQAFAKQFADVGLIVTLIMGAVFFTLLLLTGNTMTQAVRERIPELAVLKTLGFSNRSVLALVLAESALLLLIGGLIGMVLATITMQGLAAANAGMLPVMQIPARTWVTSVVLMALIGAVVGLPPALRAMRLKIVDALAGR